MGKVVPLQNVYSNQWRLAEMVAIGELILRAEQLFDSLTPAMSFAYREVIVQRATELLNEAQARRDHYFRCQGKPPPATPCLPVNYTER